MTCESISTLLADYWAGTLDAAGRERVELHLAGCADCRRSSELWTRLGTLGNVAPSVEMRPRFEAMLAAYQEGLHDRAPVRRFQLSDLWPRQPRWQVAIALICLLGGALGGAFGGREVARSQAQAGEIARLRAELASTRETTALSLLQQDSASDRLRGVSWSTSMAAPDQQVLAALLSTLKSDPSVDVRLAAAEALRQYGRVPLVRQGLIEALNARHQSPLVQVALIDVLAELRERGSVNLLKRMEADREVDSTVRERAEWAVQQF
jgi:anti-sigma factor RsiW